MKAISYKSPRQENNAAMERIRQKVETCIQCGTCTGSCPNVHAMDATPRMLWKMILMGQSREIFESRTFELCSQCYCCTLRCPRGLALTETMAELKQMATAEKPDADPSGTAFHRAFLGSVRRWGRVQETRMMSRYMTAMAFRSPLLPFKFIPLGLRMFRQGKMSLRRPEKCRSVEDIFSKLESRGGRQ